MRLLLDTNVILDVWLIREPFFRDSTALLGKVEEKQIYGIISPTSVTTLHYLSKKALGERRSRALVENLLKLCRVGALSSSVFDIALESRIIDFEDAVIEAVAIQEQVDVIVTRNLRDFRNSRVPAKDPGTVFREMM